MKCQEGCTCARHRGYSRACAPGCTCARHSPKPERGQRISAAKKGKRVTHGLTHHPLYFTWTRMMARCYNPLSTGYKYWGGRGITVCQEWHDVRHFIWWMESCEGIGWRPDGLTLDRIDNDGNYEPGNVRWATHYEQVHNRREYGSAVGTVL